MKKAMAAMVMVTVATAGCAAKKTEDPRDVSPEQAHISEAPTTTSLVTVSSTEPATTTTEPVPEEPSPPARLGPMTVTTPIPVPSPVDTTPLPAVNDLPPDAKPALLACIRSYEQGAAGYATDTGNGYEGAYQFHPYTWGGEARGGPKGTTGAVTRAGHPEWAASRASDAPPYVQDAAAWKLYTESGLAPWPTPARAC